MASNRSRILAGTVSAGVGVSVMVNLVAVDVGGLGVLSG